MTAERAYRTVNACEVPARCEVLLHGGQVGRVLCWMFSTKPGWTSLFIATPAHPKGTIVRMPRDGKVKVLQ